GIDTCKAALRGHRKIARVDIARRTLDALHHVGLALHGRHLGRDDAEHDRLMARHQPERGERASTWRIVFKEVELNVERVEQTVRHLVIAAFRMPLAAAVAPAQMHADGHVGWRILEDAVRHRDVFVDEGAPIVAARVQPLPDFGIAELSERRLVDLDVSAAGGAERVELTAKRLDDVSQNASRSLYACAKAALSPPRKWRAQGPGMVIFGTSPLCARMNWKSGTLIGRVQRTRLLMSATGCAARRSGSPPLASSPPTVSMLISPSWR